MSDMEQRLNDLYDEMELMRTELKNSKLTVVRLERRVKENERKVEAVPKEKKSGCQCKELKEKVEHVTRLQHILNSLILKGVESSQKQPPQQQQNAQPQPQQNAQPQPQQKSQPQTQQKPQPQPQQKTQPQPQPQPQQNAQPQPQQKPQPQPQRKPQRQPQQKPQPQPQQKPQPQPQQKPQPQPQQKAQPQPQQKPQPQPQQKPQPQPQQKPQPQPQQKPQPQPQQKPQPQPQQKPQPQQQQNQRKQQEEEKGPIHNGVQCDGCHGSVRGVRYKCRVCPDYDLCQSCKNKGIHTKHPFVEIMHQSQAQEKGPIHNGVTCDGCHGSVRGVRYKCRVCPNYDLCQSCKNKGIHTKHPFVEIMHQSRGNQSPRLATSMSGLLQVLGHRRESDMDAMVRAVLSSHFDFSSDSDD